MAEPDAGDGKEQAHRYDENDRQRQAEAFVLRGQHQEHKQDAQRININRRVAGEDALVAQLRPFRGHTLGQLLADQLGHERLSLAGAESRGRRAVDLRRGRTVVTHRAVRTVGFLHLHQSAERHALALRVTGLEPGDVFGPRAEGSIGLRDHLESAAKPVEVVHIKRA